MENPKPNNFKENADKIVDILGQSPRMSREQKKSYLVENGHKFFHNVDLVSAKTYQEIFAKLDLDGKTIINVGAGYSISPNYNGTSPIIEGLNEVAPNVTLIPIDYDHNRTRSWPLLETNDLDKDNNIKLEPVTGDATSLPFKDNSIDGYLSTNLINEPRKVETESVFVKKMLAEAYRVLQPGGFIIVSSFGYIWWKLANGQIIYNDAIDIEEIVEKDKIKRLMIEAGFKDITEIALDQNEIDLTLKSRLEKNPNAIEAGIRDECAFFAVKA
jgi:SAM-dependent methyltransferase